MSGPIGPCIVSGCDRLGNVPGASRGMCRPHYQRFRATQAGPCIMPDCATLQRARGLCPKHLSRLRNHGTLDLPSVADRFWPQVRPGAVPIYRPDLGPCWLWGGTVGSKGYGRLTPHRGLNLLAHRWAYEHMVAEIPDGLQIDHLCRVRHCVNPYHLEPVTRAENLRREHEARRAA